MVGIVGASDLHLGDWNRTSRDEHPKLVPHLAASPRNRLVGGSNPSRHRSTSGRRPQTPHEAWCDRIGTAFQPTQSFWLGDRSRSRPAWCYRAGSQRPPVANRRRAMGRLGVEPSSVDLQATAMTALAHVPNGWRRGASVSTFTLQAVQESNHARRRIWSPSGCLSLRPVAPGVGLEPTHSR